MAIFSIFRDYLVWHYSIAYVDGARIWWNYMWFINHLFSVPDVIMSLFSPFKRLDEKSANILVDPSAFFSAMFVNIMMRIVGFVIRVALLAIALILFVFTIVTGVAFLFFWTGLPILLVHFTLESVRVLIA